MLVTTQAADQFRRIFAALDFHPAIRLGSRVGEKGREDFIDFVPEDSCGDDNLVYHFDDIKVIIDRIDEDKYSCTVIDYIDSGPEGFLFKTEI